MILPPRDSRGLSQSLQLALVWPLLLLSTLGLVQAGLWLHARNVAERAAIAAVDEARGSQGSPDTAREVAVGLADAAGLQHVVVAVTRSGTRVDATVSAEAPSILELGLGRVREQASAPLERVTPP